MPNKAGTSVVTKRECAKTVGEKEKRNKAIKEAEEPYNYLAHLKIKIPARSKIKSMGILAKWPIRSASLPEL